MNSARFTSFCWAILVCACSSADAQDFFGPRPPVFESTEVSPELKITFRLHATKAESVKLSSSDLPGLLFGIEMTKGDEGVWNTTVGPVAAGSYRYNFSVDGLTVVDPRNPVTSESNTNTSSLLNVAGSDVSDLNDVPHGSVSQVHYFSKSLKRFRRMHVYTPPGYENGDDQFPVLYLLHGAMDCDSSWSTVGRAGYILDNLIASGRARPMIVIMPAGHTGPFQFGPPGNKAFERQMEEFSDDFVNDLKPYVEARYRLLNNRDHRAIAGLSMGGAQTLNIACEHLDEFGSIGVFSSGVLGIAGGFAGEPPNTQWEEQHKAMLDHAEGKQGLRLVWFACGRQDFLRQTSSVTVKMLKSHGFDVISTETDGGHTWTNWRNYLHDFAPRLFVE